MTPTGRPPATAPPSAATPDMHPSATTHRCPGGCGTLLPARLFACDRCFRLLPHALRQEVIRTRRRKYLDAERLDAIHAAEDHLDRLAAEELGWEPKPELPAVTRAVAEALEKRTVSERLGKACLIDYHRKQNEEKPATMPEHLSATTSVKLPRRGRK